MKHNVRLRHYVIFKDIIDHQPKHIIAGQNDMRHVLARVKSSIFYLL